MDNKFEIVLLAEAFEFLKSLDIKHSNKILFNIRKSQQKKDPELFKKLTDEIWESRTLYQGLQYRMLAFWDKTDNKNTLVMWKRIKQMFCKHTWVPSVNPGYHICIDCYKHKKLI